MSVNHADLSAPDSKSGRLQRECLKRLREHERDPDGLPTSVRFIFYELVVDGITSKEKKERGRRNDQDVCDAVFWLRDVGLVPWDWISDETRSLTQYRRAPTVADYISESIDLARIDPWDGEPQPMIITESRSLGGVLRDKLSYAYMVDMAPTNGQVGGFLRTDVAPKLRPGQRVLYLGDFDWSGGQIEANTRDVLERLVGGELDWHRVALTEQQVRRHRLPSITKTDRRYTGGKIHEAVECEALKQPLIVKLVRDHLDSILPEPLGDVRYS